MATSTNMKIPPEFKEDQMEYETWRKDLELWTLFTDLPKEKWAIAVHLTLKGRARMASSELSVPEISSVDGYQLLLEKLDRVFRQDDKWRCFNAYLAFENLKREPNGNIEEYLSAFDSKMYQLRDVNVELPDAILACRLVKSCNLSDIHFQLALSTTPEMTFMNMRHTLKRLFTECGVLATPGSDFTKVWVKNEPENEMEALYNQRSRRQYQPRGNYRGFPRKRRVISKSAKWNTLTVWKQ